MRKVITIDGLAATGKSTLAHLLAKSINYYCFSSGLLYRLVGYAVIHLKADIDSESAVLSTLLKQNIDIGLDNEGKSIALLDGRDITSGLFSTEVSEASSKISVYPQVRAYLLDKQRGIFDGHNLVAEGRDMGTVVFADANIKFFVEADINTRIERRVSQISKHSKYTAEDLELLKKKMEIEIIERDNRDANRLISPTIPAADAILINNSSGKLTEVVEKMYDFVSKKGLL